MPITIQNQPSAGIIGGAANLVGLGQYEERRRAERAKYYQLAQQERMQVRGLQAQDYFQNKQFAVQAQRDQMNAFVQQRRDERVGLMQQERDVRLHRQQLDRFGQEQEMKLNTAGKAKEQEFVRRQQTLTDALNSNLIDQTQYEDASFRVLADRSGVPWHTLTDDTISMEEHRRDNVLYDNGMVYTRNPETGEVSVTQGSRYGGVTPATFQDQRVLYDDDGNETGLYLDEHGSPQALPPTAEQALENDRETQRLTEVARLNRQIAQERTRLRAVTRLVPGPDEQNVPERVYTDAQIDEMINTSYGPALRDLGVEPPSPPAPPPPPPPPTTYPRVPRYGPISPDTGEVMLDEEFMVSQGFDANTSQRHADMTRELWFYKQKYPSGTPPQQIPEFARQRIGVLNAELRRVRNNQQQARQFPDPTPANLPGG
jgi:hypothetical protein